MNVVPKNKLVFLLWICIVILFGVSFLLTPVLRPDTSVALQFWRLPLGSLLFIILTIGIFHISKYNWRNSARNRRIPFLSCFAGITVMGIIYLVVFWPGTGMWDTLAIVRSQKFGLAIQHPWFYMCLVKFIRETVFACGGGYEATMAMVGIVQILLTAAIYSYCIVWMQKKNIPFKIIIPITLFYIFCPFLNLEMINLFKDIPFSLLLLAWMPLLYDFWESKGKSLKNRGTILKISLCLIFSLVRHNGIYVSAFILFFMLIISEYRKQVLALCLVLICTIAGDAFFEKQHRIVHLFKETVGVPLTQVGGVIYYNGKISNEDKKFINQVVPLDFIKGKYNPYNVNKLKWGGAPINNKFLNTHRKEFLKTWARLAFPNFKIYADTYLRITYGFWAIDTSVKKRGFTTIYEPAFDEWFRQEKISIKSMLPENIQETVEPVLTSCSRFIGEGLSFWLFILLWIVFGLKNGAKSLIVGMPIIGNWLTIMMATSTAYGYRYVLCLAMALPLMLGMLFLKRTSTNI